jgi:hypothetical protein
MDEQAPPYLALCSGPIDDKTLEKAIEVFEDKERREAFYRLFKELEMLYEIISPDVFLRPHIENYGNLSLLYQIVTNAFSKKVALIKDLMRKTEDLVKRTATGTGFELAMKVVRIDDNTVEALKTEKGGEPPKVINLGKSLLTAISEEANNQPYLIPIGERTEAILEGYDDRQITTQSALQQLAKLMEEYLQAKLERDRTGFDINTFTLFWVLKQSGAREADQVAPKVDAAFRKYPNYRDNVTEERQLKAEVYKLVLPAVGKDVNGSSCETAAGVTKVVRGTVEQAKERMRGEIRHWAVKLSAIFSTISSVIYVLLLGHNGSHCDGTSVSWSHQAQTWEKISRKYGVIMSGPIVWARRCLWVSLKRHKASALGNASGRLP